MDIEVPRPVSAAELFPTLRAVEHPPVQVFDLVTRDVCSVLDKAQPAFKSDGQVWSAVLLAFLVEQKSGLIASHSLVPVTWEEDRERMAAKRCEALRELAKKALDGLVNRTHGYDIARHGRYAIRAVSHEWSLLPELVGTQEGLAQVQLVPSTLGMPEDLHPAAFDYIETVTENAREDLEGRDWNLTGSDGLPERRRTPIWHEAEARVARSVTHYNETRSARIAGPIRLT